MPERQVDEVLAAVVRKIRPSASDQAAMQQVVEKVVEAAKRAAGKSVRPLMCGSVEKGTWLAGKRELDLFLLFSTDVSREELEKRGLETAKKLIALLNGKWQIAYAEHPYLRGSLSVSGSDYSIDVVPAYDVPDPARIKSAVDRTPHHVSYIKKKFTPDLTDTARLIKAFAKAAGAYGADVRTQGLSGYLCELLALHYGSFARCASEASRWQAGVVIDIENRLQGQPALEKFRSPLIVIDPVDPNRNVAAAVSAESFYCFAKACRDFLALPHQRWFFPEKPRPYTPKEISAAVARRRTRWYVIRFVRPEGLVDDILWPQMRRASSAFEGLLNEGGFRVLGRDVWADGNNCILLFELEVWQVPRVVKHIGPSIWSHKQAMAFLEHYNGKNVRIEKDSWVSETEREHTVALDFLKAFLRQPEQVLLGKGIPNRLAPIMPKSEVASGAAVVTLAKKLPPEFGVFVRDFLERDLNVL